MKKNFLLIAIIFSLLLTACTGNGEPPASAPTNEPTITVEAVVEVTQSIDVMEEVSDTATPMTAEETQNPSYELEITNLENLLAQPWQWVSFTNPVEMFDVENPESYLLSFNEDSSVNIKADCNNAIGNYKADESSLTIEIGPMTLAACLPESRSDQFIQFLTSSAIYFFQDKHLFIDLFADGGTMEFAPADEGSALESSINASLSDILGNLSYSGLFPDQKITLTDGSAYYEDGGTGRPFVHLIEHLIAMGDIDVDGAEDAVALLVDYSSGSGNFVFLAPVLNVWGEPMPMEALMIGDRTPVKSLTIDGNQVIVELITQGPGDPACCPTWNMRKLFNLEGDRMVERSSEELSKASLDDLSGTSWRLVDLNLDQEPVLPETEITLRLDNRQISGSTGCNSYNSIVNGEEDTPQAFVAGPISATRMVCSDPISTQENTYLTRLASVVSWRYDFSYLSLIYKFEDNEFGELLFAPMMP